MKRLTAICAVLFVCVHVFSQSVGIGEQRFTPASSAALEIRTSDKGILIPRLTEDEKQNIESPSEGLLIYQTNDKSGFYYFKDDKWYLLNDALNTIDKDTDNRNELQTLSLDNNQLHISNGNTVEFNLPSLQDYQSLTIIDDTLKISNGNYVLIPQPDNLGTHIATKNIQTKTHYISADGDNEGILISEDGTVNIFGSINLGTNAVQGYEIESNAITTGKIANGQITLNKLAPDVPKGLVYKGTWNASTNDPNISSGIGINSEYYVVSIAGSINLGYGLISFDENDWVIYNGTDWVKVGSGNSKKNSILLPQISDIRFKEKIEPTRYGLDDLAKVNVVDFDYKEGPRNQTGVIAQDLYEIYPSAVVVGDDNSLDTPWKVNYELLAPLIIKATQELDSKLDKLEAYNKQLIEQNETLIKRIEALEQANPTP